MAVGTYALTSSENVQKYRLVNGKPLETKPEVDDLIDILIDSYSAKIETYCDRKFMSRSYTEYLSGCGSTVLFPKQYPITSVSGIWDDSSWTWTDDYLVDSTTYTIVNDNSIALRTSRFGSSVNNIKIVYTAGFTTVPADVENVCIIEIMRAFDRMSDLGIGYKLAGDSSITITDAPFLLSSRITLDAYRRKVAL